MRLFTLLSFIAICSLLSLSVSAQSPQRFLAEKVGSVRLDTIREAFDVNVHYWEAPPPDASWEKKNLRLIKEGMRKQYPNKRQPAGMLKGTAVPMPVLEYGFRSDSSTGIPPDNDFAINRDGESVSVVNSSIVVHNAATGQIISRRSLRTFAAAAGLNHFQYDYKYDPKIIYDPEQNRFICVMLNSTNDRNWIVVGFSDSSSALGAWHFYKYYGNYSGDTTWFDYPAIALSKDEIFLTGNKIMFNGSWQAGFRQTLVYQIDKMAGYQGDSVIAYQIWDSIAHNGRNIRNLFPVKSHNSTLSNGMYFLSNRNFDVLNDTVFMVHIPQNLSSPNPIIDIKVLKSPIAYGVPPDGRQTDTNVVLATNDGRILGAFHIGNQIQFVSTSMDTSTGSSAIYHGVIEPYMTTPNITHAKLWAIDTLDFGYPNISFAGTAPGGGQTSIINFNYTGPNRHPGMGAILYDGTDYSDMLDVRNGAVHIAVMQGKSQRWGDYTGSQRDYEYPGVVWVNGIFGRIGERYGCWAAKLSSPLPNNLNTPKKISASSKLYPNPALSYITADFENPKMQDLSFSIYSSNGALIRQIHQQRCKQGRHKVDFNIHHLSPGQYYLSIRNGSGESVATHSFLRP